MTKRTAASNIARNISAAKKQVDKVSRTVETKKSSAQLRRKKSYTVRELPISQKKKFNDYLPELEKHSAELDKLKKPGEFWAVNLFDKYRTKIPFKTMAQVAGKLSQYKDLMQQGSHRGKQSQELIDGISIIKFGDPNKSELHNARQYRKEKEAEVAKREKRKGKVIEESVSISQKEAKLPPAKSKRKQTSTQKSAPITKRSNKIDIMADLVSGYRRMEKELAKLKRDLAKERKSRAKKAAKKAAPKKTVPAKKASKKKSTKKR